MHAAAEQKIGEVAKGLHPISQSVHDNQERSAGISRFEKEVSQRKIKRSFHQVVSVISLYPVLLR
jgi:hypothetical protein